MLCPKSSGETDLLDDGPLSLPRSPRGTWRAPAVRVSVRLLGGPVCCVGGRYVCSCNQILQQPLDLVRITREELWKRAPPAGPVPYGVCPADLGADGGPRCGGRCRLSPPGFQGVPSANQTQRKAERKGPR